MIGFINFTEYSVSMRAQLVSFLVLASMIPAAFGDFESASSAYRARNYPVAFEEFSELARTGDPRAQTVLAIMYKYGESVRLDLTTAFDWYMKAAIQGYPPAQFNVGTMLLEGHGVPEDKDQALLWLSKSAEAGYKRAADTLAELKGDDLILHDEEPVAWSNNWNLRLPNELREDAPNLINSALKVYRVQVGAMSSLDGAERLWQQMYVNNEDLFNEHQPIFPEGTSADRTIYRVQVGPFDDRLGAARFCERFQAHFSKSRGCLVVDSN